MLLYGLGNVKLSKSAIANSKKDLGSSRRLMEESCELHMIAREQIELAAGKSDPRVGDLCHKLASHCIANSSQEDAL